jgi:hypothetical protein
VPDFGGKTAREPLLRVTRVEGGQKIEIGYRAKAHASSAAC